MYNIKFRLFTQSETYKKIAACAIFYKSMDFIDLFYYINRNSTSVRKYFIMNCVGLSYGYFCYRITEEISENFYYAYSYSLLK